MNDWLLDTNIISEIIRRPTGPAAVIIRQRLDKCCTSLIVVAELEFGLIKKRSLRREEEVRAVLATIPILPWEHPAERHYALIRAALESAGNPIGNDDLFIAAHALALDATLITANEREFRRVPGLKVENWSVA